MHYLYSIPFGDSVDFDEDNVAPVAELGDLVYSVKPISNGLIVVFEYEETVQVGVLSFEKYTVNEDKSHKLNDFSAHGNKGEGYVRDDGSNDYSLMKSNDIIYIKKVFNDTISYIIINNSSAKVNTSMFKIEEYSNYKYCYPYLLMIKGGNEIFRYNYFRDRLTYVKLNSCFAAVIADQTQELSYKGLVDIGDHYLYADLNCSGDRSQEFVLEYSKRRIFKKYLPK